MNSHRFPLFVPALLAAALSFATACSAPQAQSSAAPAERVAQVRTITLAPRTVVDRTSLPASLEARQRAVLAAEVGGAVEAVRAELGQAVAKGQLLAAIDERSLAQQVAEAEAFLRQAKLQFERAENLFERKAVTKAQLLDAVTNRDVAEARLASAKLALDKARVTAPWAGRIAARHVEVGSFVAPGTPLFELVDASRVKVRAEARSADVRFLSVGREVEVTFDAFPDEKFPARIERLGAELDPQSRTLAVEAELANGDGRLKPGMLARLDIPRQTVAGALVAAMAALVDLGGSKAVWTISEGRAVRREVTLGIVIGEEVVITGLAAGTQVIIEGQHAVGENQPVEEV
ncbi:MAG: efflux RND transporter periplasmic adaptor subunit [Thermoanaerobaculia bacterium]